MQAKRHSTRILSPWSRSEKAGDARSKVNDSAKAVVLCEYVIHVVWISVLLLAITLSVQYETKSVSERSVWMLRSDTLLRYSFFYSGDNDYQNSVISFCNTALLLISDFFSTPIAKQKEAWYNMTRRTEMVIWMVNELGFYRLWNRTTSQGAAPSHRGWRKPQWISWQRLSVSQNVRFINSTNPRNGASLAATTVWGLILTVSHKE